HEHVPVAVEVFVLLAVEDDLLDVVVGREPLLDNIATLQVLKLNLPVGAQVAAGLLVAIKNHPDFAIVHDGLADLDVPHFHRGHGPAPLTVRKGDRTPRSEDNTAPSAPKGPVPFFRTLNPGKRIH